MLADRKLRASWGKESESTYQPVSEPIYKSAIRPLIPSLYQSPPSPIPISEPTETIKHSPSPPPPPSLPPKKRQLWQILGVNSTEEALILMKEARQLREEKEKEKASLPPMSLTGESNLDKLLPNKKLKIESCSLKVSSLAQSDKEEVNSGDSEDEETDTLLM